MAGRISQFNGVEVKHGIKHKRLELQAEEHDDAQRATYRATVRLDFKGGAFREGG